MYKFTLQPTEISLHDPTVPGETKLNFIEKGLTYTKFPTKVKDIGSTIYDPETNSGLDSNQKEMYEKELEEILKNNIDNVEEVIVFDHVIRSSKVAGKGTKILGLPTYIPYPDNLPIHINSVPYFQEQDILQPYMFMEIMIMIKALKELKTYLEMKSLPNGSRMVNMRIMLALSMSGDHWIIQLKNVHWVMLILIQ